MTAPNRATLWGEAVVDELASAGVDAACVAPGSRSTPLTVALADHSDVAAYSHLDERSAAFFALGRARATDRPTALVCTSGTAAANFHPAVIEADASRVPLVVLTADRPAELRDSGANQTIDQTDLYGDAVRWHRTLPEPAPEPRRLRSVRTAVCRAVSTANGTPPGPVHLNVPVAKPLEPTPVDGDVPDSFEADHPLAATGREGPFVRTHVGTPELDPDALGRIADELAAADRGLIAAGPAVGAPSLPRSVARLARAAGAPLLADPLSGLRFGDHVAETPVASGYDSYLAAADDWPDPDVVVRFGASPTSKRTRRYLRDAPARQFVVDPAGGWPEAEFTATDLVAAAPDRFAAAVADRLEGTGAASGGDAGPTGGVDGPNDGADGDAETAWTDRFEAAEAAYWDAVDGALDEPGFEGAVAAAVVDALPEPARLVVSNSMPVRDVDRFGRASEASLAVAGNRGASGIDGVVSTALGAASGSDAPTTLLIGDLAFYHDANGLLAVDRCGVDATIVIVNNDGGGIFHKLPIEDFDPPFTEQFRTPHGLDFAAVADYFDCRFERVADPDALADRVAATQGRAGCDVIEVALDAAESHRTREALHERAVERVRDAV